MEDVAISPLVQPDRQVAGLHIAGASVIVTLLHLPTQERMCVSYVACSGCPCAQTAYTANAAGVGTVAGNGGDNLPRITSVPVLL